MTRAWNCLQGWRTIYTRAEVIAHGWSWHAGTAPIIVAVGCLGLTGAAPLPPLPAQPGGVVSQPAAPAPDYGPSPLQFLPTPEEFSLPIPSGGFFIVTPGLVTEETTPAPHPCQPAHWWDGSACVEGKKPPPADVPEPAGVAVLGAALVALAAMRRRKA
jgi:hypothetical protein